MAVYTPLSNQDIEHFLSHYALGKLVAAEPIAEGIENTNYIVTTGHGTQHRKHILTVFEQRTDAKDIPFFMELMEWLANSGIACPRPVKSKDGLYVYLIKNKPAALVSFIEGMNNPEITPIHLQQVGALTARIHLAAESFPRTRRNTLSFSGWQELFSRFRHRANELYEHCESELAHELDYLDRHWPSGLPRGIIHADLFPDNVFFKEDMDRRPFFSGVIDFYFACNDFWMYDLMICMNAWCFDREHKFVPERARALFSSYHRLRAITPAERAAMPILARAAAMRIVVTRVHDWLNRVPDALVTPKDPMEYIAKMRFHHRVRDHREYGV